MVAEAFETGSDLSTYKYPQVVKEYATKIIGRTGRLTGLIRLIDTPFAYAAHDHKTGPRFFASSDELISSAKMNAVSEHLKNKHLNAIKFWDDGAMKDVVSFLVNECGPQVEKWFKDFEKTKHSGREVEIKEEIQKRLLKN